MIKVAGLNLRVGGFTLSDIAFTVPTGSYAVLMGRSGCGKTTILEALCGLRAIESGEIWLGQEEVSTLAPAKRKVGYVPQDLALFSHLNVQENIAFGLKARREPTDTRVDEIGGLLGISDLFGRTITGLSGGEAQRVALGRALAFRPSVLLLDEPLSSLDQATREEMHNVLRTVRAKTGVTTLHVTHDKNEAVALADVLLTLHDGKVTPVQ